MRTQPVPLDDLREPFDLVAVQADDELINGLAEGLAVSAPGRHGYDADDRVAAMLAAWKADVDAEPIPQVDLDAAVGAVLAGRRPSGRGRYLVPVAGAAALMVVAITGVSVAAQDTRPGDALFSVSKVLYAEEAASYEALATVEQSQAQAERALAVGDKQAAAVAVAQGQDAADDVLAEHGLGEILERLRMLETEVAQTSPGVPNRAEDRSSSAQSGAAETQGQPGPPPDQSGRTQDSNGPAKGPGPGVESDTNDSGPDEEAPPRTDDDATGPDDENSDTNGPGNGGSTRGGGAPAGEPDTRSNKPPVGTPTPSSQGPVTPTPVAPVPPANQPTPDSQPTPGSQPPPGSIDGSSGTATGKATTSGQPPATG